MIPTDISELLEKALEEKIENFDIENHGGNAVGQGYLGDFLFLSLKNKNTGKQHHLVIKQVISGTSESTREFMTSSYLNEIFFYTKVIPRYLEFQKSHTGNQIFDNFPQCLAVSKVAGKEKLVLENLKFDNYEVHPKNIPLTDGMYEEIFKVYGRYHGLSLAFKELQSEEFSELASSLSNNFKKLMEDHNLMVKALNGACYTLKAHLDTIGEKEISEKFEKYVKNGPKLLTDALSYKSAFSVILHGDCWSNNLMFEYNESREIKNIKLIDFQMVTCGSPVLDLTYSFYSGAPKETLDKLDHFLKIYYDCIRDTVKQYGCDLKKLFTLDDLKNEWKQQHAFGFLMGLVLWMNKNLDPTKEENLSNMMDRNDGKVEEAFMYNTEGFRKSGTDLVRHMYENDFL